MCFAGVLAKSVLLKLSLACGGTHAGHIKKGVHTTMLQDMILIESINGVNLYELPPLSAQEQEAWLMTYQDGSCRERQTFLTWPEAEANFVRRVAEEDYR